LLVRVIIFPLTYQQLSSSQMTQALSPKMKEIREKYPDDKQLQNQMIALLYQETQVIEQ
jgi:YidC/Oxa1 family membrane protein insertase